MTTISSTSTLNQQLYQRLFDKLNTDGDDAVSLAELGAGDPKADAAKTFKTLDADGDGKIIRSEMTPSAAFGQQTVQALIVAQEESSQDPMAALFKRADLNGDGALDADEKRAEADLRRAASLDAGYAPNTIFHYADRDGDGLTRPDEVLTLRTLRLDPSAIRLPDQPMTVPRTAPAAPPRSGPEAEAPTSPLTPEEQQARLEQFKADHAERWSGPDGSLRYLDREIGGLRDKAAVDLAATPMSDTLVSRLMQQFMTGWTTDPATGPSKTTTA